MKTTDKINSILHEMEELLRVKNKRYGDATIYPLHIFSEATGDAAIRIRIDDKLKRIANSTELRKNDVVDLLGYLILLAASRDWTDFSDLID